jgi:DHA2 family multidrug resistance protein-like MFS transporter
MFAWLQQSDRTPPPDGLAPGPRRVAMATLAMAVTMTVLDSSLSNIALPAIGRDLGASPAATVWVVNAYQLTVAMTLLPLAALGERMGYRRIYLFGLAVFVCGALGSFLASNLTGLIAMRVLAGLGGAGIMSVNSALVRFVYPRAQLGKGMAMNSLVVATGLASGPSIAALILAVAPWPYLFAIHIPLGVLTFLLSLRTLPETERVAHPFDWPSVGLYGAAVGLFIIALGGVGHGEGPRQIAAEAVLALVAGVLLVRRQLHRPAPMLPLDLFRIRLFTLSVLTAVCIHAAQTIAFIALPFWFVYASGASQAETGLLMTPWPFMVIFIAPLAGRLSDRYPAGLLGGVGLAVMLAGLLAMLALPAGAGFADTAWRMALCGIGFGFFQTPNNRALIGAAPRERSGVASGMLSTSRLVGQSVGGALVAVVFGLSAGAGSDVASGARASVMLAAGFAATGMLVSWLRLANR